MGDLTDIAAARRAREAAEVAEVASHEVRPDDHGTLRDENGAPMVYRPIAPAGGRSVPLTESQVWPDDMLLCNTWQGHRVVKAVPGPGQRSDADFFAEHTERLISSRLGLVPCPAPEGHDYYVALDRPCDHCGAVR